MQRTLGEFPVAIAVSALGRLKEALNSKAEKIPSQVAIAVSALGRLKEEMPQPIVLTAFGRDRRFSLGQIERSWLSLAAL